MGEGPSYKFETSLLGLLTMFAECPNEADGGMLWRDVGDAHLAIVHPAGLPLAPVLQRFSAYPPASANIILSGWANGGHKGVVLIHNTTPKRIIVTLVKADCVEKHRSARWHTMSQSTGGDHVAAILPTDVALLQTPDISTGACENELHLEFAYGCSEGSAIGQTRAQPGSALTIVCLDDRLQVSNTEGEACSVEEGTIKVINNHYVPMMTSMFNALEGGGKRTRSPILKASTQAAEQRLLPVPDTRAGSVFLLEMRCEAGEEMVSELTPGQCVSIEEA